MHPSKNNCPVKNGLHRITVSSLSNPYAAASRLFLQGVLILLFTSCSSTHKLTQKTSTKETSTDKSITTGTTYSQSITTEKVDSTIVLKADSARINMFVPADFDTASIDQEIESGNIKITIHAKPVIVNGKRTGTNITATAIKKEDSVTVKVDKKTITNVTAQTQTKNDITEVSKSKEINKDIKKSRFSFTGILLCLGILIILLIAAYYYFKHKIPFP